MGGWVEIDRKAFEKQRASNFGLDLMIESQNHHRVFNSKCTRKPIRPHPPNPHIHSDRMVSSASSVTSSSLSSLSVASCGGIAAEEAKRKEEEERIKIINELQLHPTCAAKRKKHPVWKQRYYFCSMLKGHEDDVYCMKCRKWIHGGSFSHVNQHENRRHAGCDETATSGGGGGGGMQQLKLNQTVTYPAEHQARLTAKLVGFLIRTPVPPR